MTGTEGLKEDLAYVKGVAHRWETGQRTPLGIALTWTIFALVGFTWLDFDPRRGGWFLLLFCPICFGISWLIGWRAAWKVGELDRRAGRREMLHWGGAFIAVAAIVIMGAAGRLSGPAQGQLILLVIGLTYFVAGVSLAPRLFLWLGLLMMIGAVVLTWVPRWGWTTLGVLFGVGLMASSFVGGRRNE